MNRLGRILKDGKHPPRWAALLVLGEDDWGDLWLPCLNRRHDHFRDPEEPW